jgi:hypothetical protein
VQHSNDNRAIGKLFNDTKNNFKMMQKIVTVFIFLLFFGSVLATQSITVVSPNGNQDVNGIIEVQLSIQNNDDDFNVDLNISRFGSDANGLVIFNDVNWTYLNCSATTFIASPATCRFALQTRNYPDGNYFLRAALDDGGTVATDASDSSFYIDNHAPQVCFEKPSATASDKNVSFQVIDNYKSDNNIMVHYADASNIWVYLDRGLPNVVKWGIQKIDSNNVWGMSDANDGRMYGQEELFDDGDSSRVSKGGTWTCGFVSASTYGGTYCTAKHLGATATVTFVGNKITLIGVQATNGGEASATIDGRADLANLLPVDVNGKAFISFYRSSGLDYNYQYPIADDLNSGTHVLQLSYLYSGNDSNIMYMTGFIDQNYMHSFSTPFTYVNKRKIVRGTAPGTANEYVYFYGGAGGNYVGNGHFYDKIQWDSGGQEIDHYLNGQLVTMNVGDINIVQSFEFDENSVLSRPPGDPDQNIGDVQRKEIFSNKGLDVNYSIRWFNTGTPYTLTVCYISMLSLQNDRNVSQFGHLNGTPYYFALDDSFVGNVVATSSLFSTTLDNLLVGADLLNPESSYTPFAGKNTFYWARLAGNGNKVYYDICSGDNDITPTEDQTFTVKSRYTIDYNTASAGTKIGTISTTLTPGPTVFNQATACVENPTNSKLYCSYMDTGIASGNNTLSVTTPDNLGSSSTTQYSFYFPLPPDGNITRIDGNRDDLPLPAYSYTRDRNLTIDFNVQGIDRNNLLADLNYSSSSTQGTGTVIVNDLNISALGTSGPYNCQDTNFLNSTQCSIDWNISSISDGNYYLLVSVTDGTLNDFNSSDNNFMIDNTAPSISISSPTNNSTVTSSTVTIQYSGSDANSGILRYWVSADSNATNAFINNGTSTSYSFTNQSNGTHAYYVKATDNADNNSSDANVTVTVSVTSENNTTGGGYPACSNYIGSDVCSDDENCNGTWLGTYDTTRCCSITCTTTQTTTAGSETTQEETITTATKEYPTPTEPSTLLHTAPVQELLQSYQPIPYQSIQFTRTLQINQQTQNNQIKGYKTIITIKATNKSEKKLENIRIIEEIPKELIPLASNINSTIPFEILNEDPLISFLITNLEPNQSTDIQYSAENDSTIIPTQEPFNQMKPPIALQPLKKDPCNNIACNDKNPCTKDHCRNGTCLYDALPLGTTCGTNAICQEKQCIPNPAPSAGIESLVSPTRNNWPWLLAICLIIAVIAGYAAIRSRHKQSRLRQ